MTVFRSASEIESAAKSLGKKAHLGAINNNEAAQVSAALIEELAAEVSQLKQQLHDLSEIVAKKLQG
jgi:hypothetical protein